MTPRIEGKPSIEVPISKLPVENTAAEATVDPIVYLNRYPSAVGRLIRLPNGTATERTCRELYSAGEIRRKHERSCNILSDVPTYELQYGDLGRGISLLSSYRGVIKIFAKASLTRSRSVTERCRRIAAYS